MKYVYIVMMTLLVLAGCVEPPVEPTQPIGIDISTPSAFQNDDQLQIGLWNLQIFGDAKMDDVQTVQVIVSNIRKFDVFVVQEIRDADQSSWIELCNILAVEYDCIISSRSGRSQSKEQYGILYTKQIDFVNATDFNPDAEDRWERPPYLAEFSYGDLNFTLLTLHAKPDAVAEELSYLENISITLQEQHPNLIVLGDFNMDCDYYDESVPVFVNFTSVISNEWDTNVAPSQCTYDRIFLSEDASEEYQAAGVLTEGITTDVSDHYIAWTVLRRFADGS